jgi:CxxC motif-containing protein (DUF1111 family)
MKNFTTYFLVILSLNFYSCSNNDDDNYTPLKAEDREQFSGGDATVFNVSQESFGFSIASLNLDEQTDFGVGNSFFRQTWISAPSSTTARDGLGPFFNAISCASCHFKDGRGRPPATDGELGKGLLLRFSMEGQDANGLAFSDPVYGGQLQDNSILGQTPEGEFRITYQQISETLADGTVVTLQKPTYLVTNLGYGALANVHISPRIANQIIGLGLLEAIPENTILGFADENDSNKDGISGRPNYVHDFATNTTQMGRFGWKANQPNVRQQVAGALSGDMGITSPLFPNESGPFGVDLTKIPNGGTPEISEINLNRMALYAQTLAVPARRNYTDQNVLKGKKTFETINCTGCHIPKILTGNTHSITSLRNQTIRPYTDLLLHDMGEGLSDNATDFKATGSEWRTQPLWGIGLIQTVNKHTNLMHDGRARNVEEAILWHGGEAQNAKDKYKKLSKTDRDDLSAFINSL